MRSCKIKAHKQTSRWTLQQSICLFVLMGLFSHAVSLSAASPQQMRSNNNNVAYYLEENAAGLKALKTSMDALRHQVNNHEAEIRMFDEKLASSEAIIESVRDQLNESSRSHKEQLKGNSATLEEKIVSLDATTKGLVADLRQFKTHANDSTTVLMQYKQKINELEKLVEHQNQNIEHLQAAMKALMDVLQVKETPSVKSIGEVSAGASGAGASGNVYRIKSGDSLEKIARANHTTVQAIKELNGLTQDRIVVGKVLKLPES